MSILKTIFSPKSAKDDYLHKGADLLPDESSNFIAWTGVRLTLLPWLFLLGVYRGFISPVIGSRCRFYPSCSLYCRSALLRYGVVRGLWLTLKRLVRCHPWHPGGYDPLE